MLPIAAAIAVFVVLALGYFSPVLEGKRLIQGDIRHYQGMAREIVEHRDAYGDEPLWTGSMFSGMPAYQITVIWPGNALKYVDKLFHGFLPQPAGFIFLYLVGMFILLLCLRMDPLLAAVGAVAFAFSSYYLIIIEAGHNSKANAVGYMPLVLAGAWLLLHGRKLVGAALFALFLALEISMNHVQVTYYLGLLLVLFFLAEAWSAVREKRVRDLLVRGALGAVGVAFALLCNIGLLWSTYEYGQYTTRGPSELTITPTGEAAAPNRTGGLDRDYVTHWSYGRQETFTLLVPDAKGGASGSLIRSQEDLRNIPDKGFRDQVLKKYQSGDYINSYWGDQEFTSGPVYLGAVVVLLLLLMLARAEGAGRWWVLGSLVLIALLVNVSSPVLAGLLLLAYLVAGLFLWKDTLAYALFGALLLTLLLSWGHNLMPLTDFFLDHVPGYDKFRAVTILLIIVELAAPVLAVLYLDRMVKEGRWTKPVEKRFLAVGGVLALVLLVMAIAPGQLFEFFSQAEKEQLSAQGDQAYVDGLKAMRMAVLSADAWRSLGFVVVGAAVLFAFGRGAIKRGVLLAGMGLLILIDLWSVDKRYLNNEKDEKGRYISWEDEATNRNPFKPQPVDMAILRAEQNANTEADFERSLARLKAEKASGSAIGRMVTKDEEALLRFASLRRTADYRVLTLRGPFQDTRVSYFHRSLGGYHGAKLKRYQELIDFHITPEMRGLIGVLQSGTATMDALDSVLARSPVLNMLDTRYIILSDEQPPLENRHALGSAWFVDEVKEAKDADAEITALGDIDPKRTALVDARWYGEVAGAARPDSTATVSLKTYRTNDLTYEVNSTNGGVVVFSEIWYGPDWVAEIDGQPAPYVRADYVLRAMKVPAGRHEVRFHIVSRTFATGGRLASIGSWTLLVLVLAALFVDRRRGLREVPAGEA